jgi:hypothetical protein
LVRTAGDNHGFNVPFGTPRTYSQSAEAETRPRNIAVMWCIKAWNAPVDQGSIDIAALAVLAQQASEINQGTAKVATQAQTNTGADDSVIVTPKKLTWGFQFQKSGIGYCVFPSWLGGFTIQWGVYSIVSSTTDQTISFPLTFPNAALSAVALSDYTPGSGSVGFVAMGALNKNGFTVRSSSGTSTRWLAVGC